MVDLIANEDQQGLVDVAANFLAKEHGRDRLRALVDSGRTFDREFLQQCGELGWFSLALDETVGGAGLSVVEEALLFRELGRWLVAGPVLPTLLAARLAAAAGDAALVERLTTGGPLVGLAESVSGNDRLLVWQIEGVELLLVIDHQTATAALVDVDGSTLGVPVPTIDPTVRTARVDRVARGEPRASLADAGPLITHGSVLTSAMLVGIAEQVRDDSAAYAKTRVQFGQAIGAFQAVKHRCADMALRAEAGWAQTAVAAVRLADAGADAAFDVAAAKVVAADAAIRNARDNIQNHGGIGFTAEHDAHLFLGRAHVLEQTLGSVRDQLPTTLVADLGW